MKKLITFTTLLTSFLFFSCTLQPQKISYGEEACHYCQMTIVDKQHAAQIVTTKGKVFSFDAAECMINYNSDIDTETVGLYLVTDFNNPETLIDATSSSFIISENIPSPMGAYLSALSSEEDAKKLQQEKGGELYSWETVLTKLNN